jgi:hypothetical protein
MIPSCFFSQPLDGCTLLLGGQEKIESDVPNGGDGERRVILADAAGVLTKAPIECPVQCVFNGPMTARVGEQARRLGRTIGKIVPPFGRGFIADHACGGNPGDAWQARPVMCFLQPCDIGYDVAAAGSIRPWPLSVSWCAAKIVPWGGCSKNRRTSSCRVP